MHVETERQKGLYNKHFVTSQKCPYHVTFDFTLTFSTPSMRPILGAIVCKFGGGPGGPTICLREEAILVKSQKCPYHMIFDLDLDLDDTLDTGSCGPSCATLIAIQPFRTVFEIFSFKGIGLTTLALWVM